LETRHGTVDNAVFPIIVSASRATDIPAFYSRWMLNRIRDGYLKWTNPFNAKQTTYIGFRDTRVIVFWSKNPSPLSPVLDELDERGIHHYLQFTLNDYEAEEYEPGLPSLDRRVDTFLRLSERMGPERIIWRFDPLFLSDKINEDLLLEKILRLGERLRGHTRQLVFSFADISAYRGVKNSMKREGVIWEEFSPEGMLRFSSRLGQVGKSLGLRLSTCSEGVDLDSFDIHHNRCIDDDLMARLWPEDSALMSFLGRSQGSLFNENSSGAPNPLKDKGQRKECGCIFSKDIGRYNTCPHLCVYCYANSTSATIRKNFKEHDFMREEL
jgi:hypothetical protein